MSVISDQRDELRDRAGTLRTFAESIGDEVARNTMVIAATEMLEAAGTIWELRCKMADMVDQRDEIERIRVENAKLREYAESYAKAVEGEGCGWCPYDINLVCDTETMPMRDGCKLYGELRELGVKVG